MRRCSPVMVVNALQVRQYGRFWSEIPNIIIDEESGSRHDAAAIGELLATRILQNSIARELLGPQGEKRALTYGSIERPGEAAAALSFQ